jgi:pimeloyl-ACP methyl ester carboxylesterase
LPALVTDDGVKLHYEETGAGTPVVFVHEFAGDLRSWAPQRRRFARSHRCIVYNARGYPPSDVPEDPERYSQARARDDILAVLDALAIERAHIVGHSMGAFAALHFGMAYGARALSLTVAGIGYGAHPAQRARFQDECRAHAALIQGEGMATFAAVYGGNPTRVQLQNKHPRRFARFTRRLAEHSALGAANTLLGYMARRPSLYELTRELAAVDVPTLIVTGDEDEPCLEACLMMKRAMPKAGLAVVPRSGHGLNLEEPAVFNRLLGDFLKLVESGRWTARDPRAAVPSIYGPAGRP